MTTNQLRFHELRETARSNRERERENYRSNSAKEAETYRSNVAKENETQRHNLVTENEDHRWHNIQGSTKIYGDSVRSLSRLLGSGGKLIIGG